ncbi:unnamed protein product [Vitrella brassicaformis CCMP3155]|uniref:Uncharacterized protein n=2 Tax=Vitrella brassicaformis TaxID=1169539 RepID=A0A0G4EK55_VITBC|nr:unnamed protein product [Vitrella brassicaformis CCMP3155]|eukprot:CEL96901.1 unnamed protein product [Vitrella brassicaformis CCMP3155]
MAAEEGGIVYTKEQDRHFKAQGATQEMRVGYVLRAVVEPVMESTGEDLAGEGQVHREGLKEFLAKTCTIFRKDELSREWMEYVSREVPAVSSRRPPTWKAQIPCLTSTLQEYTKVEVKIDRLRGGVAEQVHLFEKQGVRVALARLMIMAHDVVCETAETMYNALVMRAETLRALTDNNYGLPPHAEVLRDNRKVSDLKKLWKSLTKQEAEVRAKLQVAHHPHMMPMPLPDGTHPPLDNHNNDGNGNGEHNEPNDPNERLLTLAAIPAGPPNGYPYPHMVVPITMHPITHERASSSYAVPASAKSSEEFIQDGNANGILPSPAAAAAAAATAAGGGGGGGEKRMSEEAVANLLCSMKEGASLDTRRGRKRGSSKAGGAEGDKEGGGRKRRTTTKKRDEKMTQEAQGILAGFLGHPGGM